MNLVKKAKNAYIIASIGIVLLGLFLIINPHVSAMTLCYIIGIMFMAFGVVKLVGFFSKDQFRLAFQFDLALGIFSIVAGLLITFKAAEVILILQVVIGIVIVIDGVFKLQTAIDAKRFGITMWHGIMILALLSVAAGVFLIVNPYEATKAVMIMTGIAFLVDGIQNLFVVLCTVKSVQGGYFDDEIF